MVEYGAEKEARMKIYKAQEFGGTKYEREPNMRSGNTGFI